MYFSLAQRKVPKRNIALQLGHASGVTSLAQTVFSARSGTRPPAAGSNSLPAVSEKTARARRRCNGQGHRLTLGLMKCRYVNRALDRTRARNRLFVSIKSKSKSKSKIRPVKGYPEYNDTF